MTDDTSIIRLEKVCKAFNGQQVLRGLNLSFAQGQTTVVIGPSGCGKSVLLKHIAGLIRPDSGRVLYRQQDMTKLSERKIAVMRRKMGFLFQGGALFDSMSVQENIVFPLAEHNIGDKAQRIERCHQVLSMVGLDGVQDKLPEELSGGQKKRVALARAIVLEPEIILYDEPTTGLDPIRSDLINELILKLQAALHTTAVVVTHDMASARKVGDRIVMLYEGHIIADAPPDGIAAIANDTVRRFVLGQASDEELAELRSGHLTAVRAAPQDEAEN